MKKLVVAVALTLAAGSAFAADGAAIYGGKCTMCHGKDGKGSPAGLKMGAKDLTGVKAAEAELAKVITDGRAKMPAFKAKLSEEEIQAVAKYVKSLQK
jgi:cytochrome c6